MNIKSNVEKNKVDMINVLRFIAFIIVFLLHTKILIPVAWNEGCDNAWILFTPAWAGVWIFLILSGYGIGAGFYSKKYHISTNGIAKYYIRRIASILPLYWFYLIVVSIFIKPEILIPSKEHFTYLLKLFFFNYQEEFYSIEYGLSWYLTTLLRLYLLAPFFYWLFQKIVTNRKSLFFTIISFWILGFAARCSMGYHISVTGVGNWSPNIYKPFYFNLDLFFLGFLLNKVKECHLKISPKVTILFRVLAFASIIILILYNSYIYYASSYLGKDYMNIYCYILPSVYALVILFYIWGFDIIKTYKHKKLSLSYLTENPLRIFDYFKSIQLPMYLFHSTILYCIFSKYEETLYANLFCIIFRRDTASGFEKSCILTLIAFIITILWSCIISKLFKHLPRAKIFSYLENIDYEKYIHVFKEFILKVLSLVFSI